MLLHVVVAKTQDTETVVLEIMRPPLVVVVLPCRIMRTAIELDDERGVIEDSSSFFSGPLKRGLSNEVRLGE